MQLTPNQAMLIYQRAIDKKAGAGEGSAWWAEVRAELEAVIEALTTAAAAGVIAWWHQVWKDVGDTTARAASRIRRHASSVLGNYREACAPLFKFRRIYGRLGRILQAFSVVKTVERVPSHCRDCPVLGACPLSVDSGGA